MPKPDDNRWSRGLAAYASQFQLEPEQVFDHMSELLGERMATEAINAGAGAWTDDVLSLRDRSLIVLAALIAQGGVEKRMVPHVRWAIEHGATPAELDAVAALLAVYVGFPKASLAAELIRNVLRGDTEP